MGALLSGYLYDLGRQLHLEPRKEQEILRELQTHVEDRVQELMEGGGSAEDAFKQAFRDMGQPTGIAREMYSVHSRGSWGDTIAAVLPHILFSLLFAFHLWTQIAWVVFLLAATTMVSLRGWRKGRPNWTYPWLGYCLVASIVSWVLALSALGYGAWSLITSGSVPMGIPIYLASLVYIPISLWTVLSVVFKVIRRDWLMASLTALPFPFLAYWLLYFHSRRELVESSESSLQQSDASTALVFLALAVTTAIFIRIGQRLVRLALLVLTAPALIIMAWLSYQGALGYLALLSLSIASVLLLLSPALLVTKLGSDQAPAPPLTEEG